MNNDNQYANMKELTRYFGYKSVNSMKQFIEAAVSEGARIRAVRPKRSRYSAQGRIHYCIADVEKALSYRL